MSENTNITKISNSEYDNLIAKSLKLGSNKEKSIPFSIEGNIKYILYTAGQSNFLENINNCLNFTDKKEKTFTLNTRNPLNKKTKKYYLLTISRESC